MRWILVVFVPIFLISCSPDNHADQVKILQSSNAERELVDYLANENLVNPTGDTTIVRLNNTHEARQTLIEYLRITRKRMDVISENIANVNTAHKQDGTIPYHKRRLRLNEENQPKIVSDTSTRRMYEPNHPQANSEGYVLYPNINSTAETLRMIKVNRQYNLTRQILQKFDPSIILPSEELNHKSN